MGNPNKGKGYFGSYMYIVRLFQTTLALSICYTKHQTWNIADVLFEWRDPGYQDLLKGGQHVDWLSAEFWLKSINMAVRLARLVKKQKTKTHTHRGGGCGMPLVLEKKKKTFPEIH